MGRNIQSVTTVMAIIALLLAIVNTLNGHLLQKREIAVCTVDLWDISANLSHSLSKKDLHAKAAQSEIDRIMTQIQDSLQSPSKYGCDIIAIKGSVFGSQVKDITAILKRECSHAISER
jgi:hypothetical protein